MSEMAKQLFDVHTAASVDTADLAESRTRRDAVRSAAATFTGARTTYRSGSVAMGVATDPLEDADSGLILDRRYYPKLGPDGDDEPPTDVVKALHEHIGPLIRQNWANATVHDMKRGVTVRFHEPLVSGCDPYVDLVVAMDRKDAPGLWIPNLKSDTWDASHPQKHVELMSSGTQSLRTLRARVVRIAKLWNKQYSSPALNSFNVVALALEAVTEVTDLATAVTEFFEHAVSYLSIARTQDPAGVSGPIRYELTKEQVIKRLTEARDHLHAALADPDDHAVVSTELHAVFWTCLPEPVDLRSAETSRVATLLGTTNPRFRETASGFVVAGAMKTQRSYGGVRRA